MTAPILEYVRSEEHTSELQSRSDLVCRLLLEKKKIKAIFNKRIEKKRIKDPQLATASAKCRDFAAKYLPTTKQWVDGFFFNDTATTEIYTLSLHDALPI